MRVQSMCWRTKGWVAGQESIAEGVESEEQAKILRLLKCDEMQGYFFSKPLSVEFSAKII